MIDSFAAPLSLSLKGGLKEAVRQTVLSRGV